MKNQINEKVDAAVIMACGMGQRMAPLTYDTPKCMLKVNGTPLIERLILQIKDKGINDIYIIVGYLHKKFEYLREKYNVNIVFNNNSKTTNTLYSLKCALPYITNKNVYICYADLFFKENVFKNVEHGSHFKGKFFSGENDEWDCLLNDKDEITHIDKHGKNSYCMVGAAYLNKNDIELISKLTNELLLDKDASSFYWEEIFCKYLDKFNGLYLEKINENSLIEYDNYDDYFNTISNNNITGCYSYSLISTIFNVDEKDITLIKCINEGITNRKFVFKINNNNKSYIMRVPGIGSDQFINRKIEVDAINKLKEYNVTENVIYIDSNTGYKIAEYYENAKTIDTTSDEELKNAMLEIKKLHNFNITIDKNKNLFDFIDCHRNIIKNNDYKYPFNDERDLSIEIDKVISIIKSYNRKNSFCHGDAHPGNILITNKGIKFIDLEYVMMFDPLFEISMFALNANFDEFGAIKLLEYYKDAKADGFVLKDLSDYDAKKLVVAYYILSQYYSYLWAITFQHSNSIDYTELLKYYHAKTLNSLCTFKKEYM